MKILLVNPPHPSIGGRIPVEHLPPLGLLSIGGPLIDAGHQVELLDAEFGPLTTAAIVDRVRAYAPEAVMMGLPTMSWPAGIRGRRYLPTTWIARCGWRHWLKRR